MYIKILMVFIRFHCLVVFCHKIISLKSIADLVPYKLGVDDVRFLFVFLFYVGRFHVDVLTGFLKMRQ